jgi:hypothetical protein
MLLKSKETIEYSYTKGVLYLPIEVSCNLKRKTVYVRIVDDDGCPALYDLSNFVIISGKLNGFCFEYYDDKLFLSHHLLINTPLDKKNIDGFWGVFFEDTTQLAVKALQIVRSAVEDLARIENVPPPHVRLTPNNL